MRCEDAEARLVELIEEELSPARRAELLTHLRGCPICGGELSAYRDLLALVRADLVPEPPPLFWEAFLPSLRHRIEQDAGRRTPAPSGWLAGVRAWWTARPRLVAGLAVAAVSLLVVIALPGLWSMRPDRQETMLSEQRLAGREGERRDAALTPGGESEMRYQGEPVVVAGELIEEPAILVAAIQQLPRVEEIADRVETAWAMRPEADPADWLTSLDEEERQILLDRMRSVRW